MEYSLLENYTSQEDIPLIQFLAISQTYHRDCYCWSYTKNGMYNIKSGYWVATHLLNKETKWCIQNQIFIWKVKAPQKISHLIWQTVSSHLAVTNNLICHHMRCENHCPRYGAENKIVNHVILKCPPALQT